MPRGCSPRPAARAALRAPRVPRCPPPPLDRQLPPTLSSLQGLGNLYFRQQLRTQRVFPAQNPQNQGGPPVNAKSGPLLLANLQPKVTGRLTSISIHRCSSVVALLPVNAFGHRPVGCQVMAARVCLPTWDSGRNRWTTATSNASSEMHSAMSTPRAGSPSS